MSNNKERDGIREMGLLYIVYSKQALNVVSILGVLGGSVLHILRRRGRHAPDDDYPVDYDFFILASTPKHGKILEDDLLQFTF